MKSVLSVVCAFFVVHEAVASTSHESAIDAWPSKPVEIVLPYSPGGTGDLLARQIAVKLEESLGRPFIVTYKSGASGTIGAESVARARPDGYTLLMGYMSEMALVPSLKETNYEITDFIPIVLAGTSPLVLTGNKNLPAENLAELINLFRKGDRSYSYASAGVGSPQHFAGELLNREAGLKLSHIPYKSGPQVMQDLVGGHVDIYFGGIPASIAQIRSGNVRPFGVTSDKRSTTLPDVEAMTEVGLSSFDISGWFALFAPAGTPDAVVDKLRKAADKALGEKDLQEVFASNGADVVRMSGEELRDFVLAESEKYRLLASELSIGMK